uniref:Uncharacterized protein n=1 Tax=Arundo donax TaxID=35708 RepID=A0A0A8ZAY7_ARUDO
MVKARQWCLPPRAPG